MNCMNCEQEKTTDYPLCGACETRHHFTNREDCRCVRCIEDRCDAIIQAQLIERAILAELAWQEEGRAIYGWAFPAAA